MTDQVKSNWSVNVTEIIDFAVIDGEDHNVLCYEVPRSKITKVADLLDEEFDDKGIPARDRDEIMLGSIKTALRGIVGEDLNYFANQVIPQNALYLIAKKATAEQLENKRGYIVFIVPGGVLLGTFDTVAEFQAEYKRQQKAMKGETDEEGKAA